MATSKLVACGLAVMSVIAACGGDDDDALPVEDDPVVTSDPSDDTTSTTTVVDDAEAAEVAVDPTALPSEPTGWDTLSADLCEAYEVADLDAYFRGEGGLAIEEGLPRGCRWAVEGLPRTHAVTVTVQPAADPDIYDTREEQIGGTAVLVSSGASDARGWIPLPDGSDDLLSVTVHGEYGVPDGRLPDDYLDPAVFGLIENLVGRR